MYVPVTIQSPATVAVQTAPVHDPPAPLSMLKSVSAVTSPRS